MRWAEIADGTPLQEASEELRAAAPVKLRSIAELSVVKLGKPVEAKQGTVPSGSGGTVVHAYNDGQAYIVEFYQPFHAVATVTADAIAAVAIAA